MKLLAKSSDFNLLELCNFSPLNFGKIKIQICLTQNLISCRMSDKFQLARLILIKNSLKISTVIVRSLNVNPVS